MVDYIMIGHVKCNESIMMLDPLNVCIFINIWDPARYCSFTTWACIVYCTTTTQQEAKIIFVVVLLWMVVLELPELKERERTNQKEVNRAYDEKRKNEEQSAAVWILKIEDTASFDIHECLFVLVGSGGEEEPDDD